MVSYTTYSSLALVVGILCVIQPIESRHRDRDSRKAKSTESIISSTPSLNLCSQDRDMKLMCHCTPDDTQLKAKKADCWVVSNDFPRKDPTWLAFHTQTDIEQLKFMVHGIGMMSYIPSDVIVTLKNLQKLTIEYGRIDKVASNAFGNLTELKNVSLPKNHIQVIKQNAFSNLPTLDEISLEQNEIIEIDKEAFTNLPTLRILNLATNNITVLHDGMFNELSSLIELRLDVNIISVLTRDTFKGLANLRMLRLSTNSINYIGETVFAELWNLQELDLDNNKIEKLSERAFDGLNNLRSLNLQNNKITHLESGLFVGVPALTSLNLNTNALETLTYNNILPLMDNLVNSTTVLSMRDNRFKCDCRLSWIFDLRNRTKNENLKYSLQHIECFLETKTTFLMNNVVEHVVDEEILDENGDYNDDAAYENEANITPNTELINLFKMTKEQLPCAEEHRDPTELPQTKESKGFDFNNFFSSSSSSAQQSIKRFLNTLIPISILFL